MYSKLDELVNAEKDRVNLYGAVLDCSAPYFMQKPAKYVCTVKLIDESIHPGASSKNAPEFLSATFFAKTAADLPQPTKVGSILRIHRGQCKKYKDQFQFNCDIGIKGSWVLYDPIDGQTPISKSSRRFTYTDNDKSLLTNTRKFIKNHFAKSELTGMSFKDAEKKKPKDFDVICYVLEVKPKDKVERIKVCDATKVVKIDLTDSRKGYVCAQEVVRIRSADFGEAGKLKLNDYSNILRIPKEFLSAKEVLKSLKGSKLPEDVKDNLSIYNPENDVVTKLTTKAKKEATSLRDLFAGDLPKNEKVFKVRVSVVEIGPKNPHDWICVADKKKNQ